MASIATKFSVSDVVYTFDNVRGIIYRFTVRGIFINTSNSNTEITYELVLSSPILNMSSAKTSTNVVEQDLFTEAEIKDFANVWLIDKSVSIFSDAGL